MRLVLLTILSTSMFGFSQTPGGGVTDIDGNNYSTVIIGTQEWMSENLNVVRFTNGDSINFVSTSQDWTINGITQNHACCYYNDDVLNESPYGKLYNWYTVDDDRNVCPTSWRVPTDDDWDSLLVELEPSTSWIYLQDIYYGVVSTTAGSALKEEGATNWCAPNSDATNSSGFTAVPGGYRDGDVGNFQSINIVGQYWTSTLKPDSTMAYWRMMNCNDGNLFRHERNLRSGLSIRCVRNSNVGIIELNESNKKQLIKITDLMGRETIPQKNRLLIYVYSDGTTKRVFETE